MLWDDGSAIAWEMLEEAAALLSAPPRPTIVVSPAEARRLSDAVLADLDALSVPPVVVDDEVAP